MKRFTVVLATILLVVGASYAYFYIVQEWHGRLLELLRINFMVSAMTAYLVLFLCVLVLRYFALMVFSYLEHIENMKRIDSNMVMGKEQIGRNENLPFVTVIVPAYNEGLIIQASLRSLLQLDYPHYEILVIDDGSTDDTYNRAQEMAGDHGKCSIRVITKKNGGKADALNTGIAQARGEFVLNMDGDGILSPNSLRDCIRHFDDPRIGAVAGNVKVHNRENLITKVQALEYVEGLALARMAQSYMRSVNIIPGPLGVFRKSALRQVKGYDSDTFAEDCDLTLKLLFLGWHIVYEPRAIAWVESPSRMLDLLKQRYRWTRGVLQSIRKHAWSLKHPIKSGVNGFIVWSMLFEGVLWPISNVMGNIFFAGVALKYGVVVLLAFWWLQLSILDLTAAAYCVVIEKEEMSLVIYALFFRVFYLLVVDVAKIFASFEELIGTKMTWGKLDREGKL